jgi:hypothetical protein
LSAEQFRATARARGYSLAALARLWGLTRSRLSQIAADPARAAHYDFALLGTPRRRGGKVESAQEGGGAAGVSGDHASTEGLELGEVFVVRDSPGEHLPEGAEGVVVGLAGVGAPARVLLRFGSGGYEEDFEVAYLLSSEGFLVRTGRVER